MCLGGILECTTRVVPGNDSNYIMEDEIGNKFIRFYKAAFHMRLVTRWSCVGVNEPQFMGGRVNM